MNLYRDKIKEMMKALDKDSLELVQQVSHFRTFSKGEYLLREGQICIYFFVSGGIENHQSFGR